MPRSVECGSCLDARSVTRKANRAVPIFAAGAAVRAADRRAAGLVAPQPRGEQPAAREARWHRPRVAQGHGPAVAVRDAGPARLRAYDAREINVIKIKRKLKDMWISKE